MPITPKLGKAGKTMTRTHGVFRQSSIDRFLKLEILGTQEIPASAARQLKMDGTGVSLRYWLLTAALLLTFGTGTHAAFIPLTATLTGAQETPPNTSPGIGSAAFILDDVGRTLVSAVTFRNLTGPTFLDDANTSAHIHLGDPGVAGPIIHPFPTAPIGVTSGAFADIWTGLTPADITALEAGGTYINIHTTASPAGEIRGQITVIPEPGSLVLLGLGLLGVAGLARRARGAARRRSDQVTVRVYSIRHW